MTDEIVVSVRDVAKKFRLFASTQERLREALHPFRKRYHREFWALEGVSLQLRRAETLGILGRNGSGKSTLLQIIAGVLRPTSGTVEVRGRMAPMLELAAGFNPEFSGRDNVLLNAAIMGLPRDQMLTRLPRIEAFADIGEFFDQPVKTYSSGMCARLAFAAAINVDPEILVVDEILSVGDARFQNKCFLKLKEFQDAGKTILFVTHNLNAVTAYCDRAILLESGRVVLDGEPKAVVDHYIELLFGPLAERSQSDAQATDGLEEQPPVVPALSFLAQDDESRDRCGERQSYNKYEVRFGARDAEIIDYLVETDGELDPPSINFGSVVHLHVKVKFHRSVWSPVVGFAVKTVGGTDIYGTNTFMLNVPVRPAMAGEGRVFRFTFPARFLPGEYFLDLGVAETDGTPGGAVIDVRRSLALIAIQAAGRPTFDGLVDLAPTFEDQTLDPVSPGLDADNVRRVEAATVGE